MDYSRLFYSNITYHCNNKCIHCLSHSTVEKKHIESILPQIQSIDNLCEKDIFVINGGEPTISKDFFNIINYLVSTNCKIIVFSNGRLLWKSEYNNLLTNLNIRFVIPLYGNKEKHNYYTQTNSFIETVKTLKSFKHKNFDLKILVDNSFNAPEYHKLVSDFFNNYNYINISGILEKNSFTDRLELGKKISIFILDLIKAGKNLKVSNIPICGFSTELKMFLLSHKIKDQKIETYYFLKAESTKKINYEINHNWCKHCKNCGFKSICIDTSQSFRVLTIYENSVFLGEE